MHLLAHGGAGGLLLELTPVLAIGALWLWVRRKSKRVDEEASAPAGPHDEAGVEQDGG